MWAGRIRRVCGHRGLVWQGEIDGNASAAVSHLALALTQGSTATVADSALRRTGDEICPSVANDAPASEGHLQRHASRRKAQCEGDSARPKHERPARGDGEVAACEREVRLVDLVEAEERGGGQHQNCCSRCAAGRHPGDAISAARCWRTSRRAGQAGASAPCRFRHR